MVFVRLYRHSGNVQVLYAQVGLPVPEAIGHAVWGIRAKSLSCHQPAGNLAAVNSRMWPAITSQSYSSVGRPVLSKMHFIVLEVSLEALDVFNTEMKVFFPPNHKSRRLTFLQITERPAPVWAAGLSSCPQRSDGAFSLISIQFASAFLM